jgi:hypothetical protein
MMFYNEQWRRIRFWKHHHYHWEEDFYRSRLNKPKYFVGWNSQTRLRRMILELRHRDKTWMPWLKYITMVRPQDPSCVARYTHTDALCWYVSVSTTRRKILVDAMGTLRTTGIHSLQVLNTAKEWVWPVSWIQIQGDWIWSRWQVSVPAVNWPLDLSELSGLFIKTPCKVLQRISR